MTKNRKRKENEDLWRARVKAWQASGLSLVRYSEQNQIPKSTLYYWQNILKPKPPSSTTSFIPVRAQPHKDKILPQECIQLKLLTGLVLQLPLSMKAENIAILLHAIGKPHD